METTLKKLEKASDAALVRLFQRGSNRAFEVLVNRHKANLKKYAHTRLRNTVLEKDALQNVWLEVVSRLRKRLYKEKGHFKEWVQSLLYWRAVTIQKTEAHFIHQDVQKEKAVTSGTPEKILFEKRLEQIRKSLSKLNSHIRIVVQLHVEKDMSFPEIAKEMHTSVNTVTSWYSRAIKKLRRLNRK